MLILTRRIGESVYIGDEVRLTVLGVRGTQVRLGINAPKDIPVHREEIYYKIKHEQGIEVPQHGNAYDNAGNIGVAEASGVDAPNADAPAAPDVGASDDVHPSPEEADPHNA